MKKRALLIIPLVICLSILTGGCSKAEYYENVALTELETFTSITGIAVNSVEEGVETVKYEYIINEPEKQPVDEYMLYLNEEYGCTLSVGESTEDGGLVYNYGEDKILLDKKEESFGDVAYVTLPLPEEVVKANYEAIYAELLSLIEEGKYNDALSFDALDDDYKDVKALKKYAEAKRVMQMLPSQGCEVPATIRLFKDCGMIYDSEEEVEKLIGYTKKLEGTYKTTSRGYDYYLYFKDGGFTGSFKKETDPLAYLDAVYIWPTDNGDVLYGLGGGFSGNYYEASDYRCTFMDSGELLVYEVSDVDVKAGTYKRISKETPPKKNL